MLKMLVSLLEQLLVENLYDATVAELEYHISSSIKGIMVKVHGFNQKLFVSIQRLLNFHSLLIAYLSSNFHRSVLAFIENNIKVYSRLS
jgi:secreted Zn-dependent insulinase-like peptidase